MRVMLNNELKTIFFKNHLIPDIKSGKKTVTIRKSRGGYYKTGEVCSINFDDSEKLKIKSVKNMLLAEALENKEILSSENMTEEKFTKTWLECYGKFDKDQRITVIFFEYLHI